MCTGLNEATTAPWLMGSSNRSVSTCETALAEPTANPAGTICAVTAVFFRFQTRTITPESIPSSAGFTAHTRTAGSLTDNIDHVVAGSGADALPVITVLTNVFWCSSANRRAWR